VSARRAAGALAAALLAAAVPGAADGPGAADEPATGPLRPEHVLVVANPKAEGSEALAKYYRLARRLLPDRVLLLPTTTEPDISREDYNEKLRDPIRAYLARKGRARRIRCIVLVWGVPVRVLGTQMTPEQDELVRAYRTISKRLHVRLAVDVKLAGSVAGTFPRPRTEGLRPLGKLFDADEVAVPDRSATFDALRADLEKEIKWKRARLEKLSDPARRRVGLRQLAALRLDASGLKGLSKQLPAEPVSGVPDRKELARRIASAEAELARLRDGPETARTAAEIVAAVRRLRGVVGAHEHCEARIRATDTAEEDASVDSELALLWEDGAELRRWRPNALNWRFGGPTTRPSEAPARMIMTARLDGPSPRDALRIIKDSIAAETKPLKGTLYIDAGGKYPSYDKHLKRLGEIVRKRTKIPVKVDGNKTLFSRGQCPDAALYVGWYSLQHYIPAFTWTRGAVGWHIASLEAVHLRDGDCNEWCVKLIQNGIAATLGAVNEPYLGAFPPPEEFFALLLTGRFTVAECYWKTVPAASWRMTLICDPLYNPFGRFPQLSVYDLPPEMGGGRGPLRPRTPTTRPHMDTRPTR